MNDQQRQARTVNYMPHESLNPPEDTPPDSTEEFAGGATHPQAFNRVKVEPEPWTTPHGEVPAAGDAASQTPADVPPAPAAATPTFRRRFSSAAVVALAAAASIAFAAGGFAAGTQHAALGPTTITNTTATQNWTFAEKVYQTANPAVVAISVKTGGSGTGFFYRPDRIVTNAHVVSSSAAALKNISLGDDFTVDLVLADGRHREGRVIAVDSRTDLAIIDVEDGLGIKPLPFANSSKARPGQPVAVIGNPFAQGQSISTGILSALARNSSFATSDVQSLLLQTDAAVNPGNSGGPLLDATGSVLGIVTLRPDSAEGRTAAGIAFALPANQVRSAVTSLEKTGKVSYPLLGVSLRDVTSDDDTTSGVVVVAVGKNSGAAKAGVRENDIITTVDGVDVSTSAAVVDAVSGHQPGDRMTLKLLRGARHTPLTKSVTLGSR